MRRKALDKLHVSKMSQEQIAALYKQATSLTPRAKVFEAGLIVDLIERIRFLEDGDFIDIPDNPTYDPIWLDAFNDTWNGRM